MTRATDAETIGEMLDRSAEATAAGVGVIWNDSVLSYRDLAEASLRVAGGLAAAGLGRGDRVAIWMPNRHEWLVMFFACAHLGAAVVVVNSRYNAREIGDLVERTEARALIFQIEASAVPDAVAGLDRSHLQKLDLFVAIGAARGPAPLLGKRVESYADLLDHPALAANRAMPDDVGVIYSTSGSTGASKLVVHTHHGLATHAQNLARVLRLDAPDSVHFLPLPLAGAYGLTQALFCVASTRPVVLQGKFEPHEAAALIRRYAATSLCAFDEIITALLSTSSDPRPFPSMRWASFGIFNPAVTDFIPGTEARGIRLIGLYGSSETQALFVMQRLDAEPAERARPGGFATSPLGRYRIRDSESGALLGPGQAGEIEVAGPSLLKEYLGQIAANAQLLPDGFFRTGDTGLIAEDGSLVFSARTDDVLRLSGYLVTAGEIQAVVAALPGVSGCEIVAIRTPDGNRPVAFVTLAAGEAHDEAALREGCARRLARFKVPIAFHAVDAFPLVGSMNAPKVDKKALREMAAARLPAA